MPVDLNQLTDDELDAIIEGARADVHESNQWRLTPRQQFAEDLTRAAEPGVAFELLFGGAAGGGKSAWMLWHLYTIALTYPGTRSLFLRKTFPELRRNAIYKSFEIFDQTHCKYMAADKEWRFKNGSVIEFGFADQDLDVYQYQGAEYVCVCLDEATQHATDFIYTYLFSRLRVTKAVMEMGITPHAILATNPGNVGAGWVRSRFIDIGDPDIVHEVVDEETGRKFRRVFVPSRLKDNPHLDEHSYRAQLAGLSPALRKALEDGNWDVVDGAYFPEWDKELHVVEPFDIPEWWTRVRAIDYGYTAPMACLWFAFDGDGNAYVYRELYERELTPPIQARKILVMSGNERIDYTVADPSIWTRTGVGLPISQQYADAGLHTRRALNARVDGWQRVRWYLRPDPERANPRAEKYVPPKLFVFSHCKNLIRTLPMLVHDPTKPEDLNTKGDDHLADALRYGLMSRPRMSAAKVVEDMSLEGRLAAKHRAPKRANDMWIGA